MYIIIIIIIIITAYLTKCKDTCFYVQVQFLANRQCHPLWRRNRGLLYTTPTKFPRLTDRLILQNVTEINTAQIPSSGQIDTSNSTCLLQAVEQCTKALLVGYAYYTYD